jgi:hypothetical protein
MLLGNCLGGLSGFRPRCLRSSVFLRSVLVLRFLRLAATNTEVSSRRISPTDFDRFTSNRLAGAR